MNMITWDTVTFFSLISQQTTDLLALLYIDDCDLFTANQDGLQLQQTLHQLQENINLWQGGLAVTGGSLSPKNLCGASWLGALKANAGSFACQNPSQPN